jgi:hypothetical protein
MEDLQNHDEDLLIDREILGSHIKRIVTADPDAPDLLAYLFVKFKRAIENGIQPVSQIKETLQVAIELTYLHTEAHAAALKLYLLYRQGELLIQDFPLALINAAINRSRGGDESKSRTNNQPNEKADSKE